MKNRFYSRLDRKRYQEAIREVEYKLDGLDRNQILWKEHVRLYGVKQQKKLKKKKGRGEIRWM